MIKITKFGGSSVADAEQFKKVKAIIEADPSRRFVVSSASGKRFKGDNKITDLLYLCQAHVTYHVDYLPLFNMIADRFRSIRDELGLKVDIETDLAKMRDSLPEMSVDEIVSRGEYFTSRLMADYLGFPFVDATDVVCINFDGTFNFNETTERLKEILKKHGPLRDARLLRPASRRPRPRHEPRRLRHLGLHPRPLHPGRPL